MRKGVQRTMPVQTGDGQEIKQGLDGGAQSGAGHPLPVKAQYQPEQRSCKGTHQFLMWGKGSGMDLCATCADADLPDGNAVCPEKQQMPQFVDQRRQIGCTYPRQREQQHPGCCPQIAPRGDFQFRQGRAASCSRARRLHIHHLPNTMPRQALSWQWHDRLGGLRQTAFLHKFGCWGR